MSNEKIIDRIKKLIALSTSSNENEAAEAAAKAQKLLAEHNLEIDEVMRSGKKNFVTMKTDVIDVYAYLRGLGMAVAASHFCEYYYSTVPTLSRKGNAYKREKHCFVGLEHNAVVALAMFEYLQQTVFRLAREESKKKHGKLNWSYITGFQNGACYRLSQRLYAMVPSKQEALAAPAGSNLPALLSLHERSKVEVREYLEKSVALVKKKPRNLSYDSQGLSDGDRAGRDIGLNTQVGGSKHRQLT